MALCPIRLDVNKHPRLFRYLLRLMSAARGTLCSYLSIWKSVEARIGSTGGYNAYTSKTRRIFLRYYDSDVIYTCSEEVSL
jgi:hypothetical protein